MACTILSASAKFGFAGDYTSDTLTKFPRFRSFSLSEDLNVRTRVYAGTRLGTQRTTCNKRITGTVSGFGGEPPYFIGDRFRFIGFSTPNNLQPCGDGRAAIGNAIVESLSVTWDWGTGNRGIEWSMNIGFQEDLTLDDDFEYDCEDEVYCDPCCPPPPVILDPCDSDEIIPWCNWQTATLNFTTQQLEFANSSTGCVIVRDVGSFDWTLDVLDEEPFLSPYIGRDFTYRLYTDEAVTRFWSLKYGLVQSQSNFNVDAETGAIITKTVQVGMQGVLCCLQEPTRGEIIMPGGRLVYPYAIPGES